MHVCRGGRQIGRRGYGSIEYEGTVYGQKVHSLRRFIELPTRTSERFMPGDQLGAVVGTRVIRPVTGAAAARCSMSAHRSGARSSSRSANRRRRSSISFTQELTEAATPAMQIGAHGKAARAQPISDLADGKIRVVEEDHGRALALGQTANG